MAGDVTIKVSPDVAQALKGLQDIIDKIKGVDAQVQQTNTGFAKLGGLIKGLGIGALVAGIASVGKSMLQGAAEMEQYTTSFEVLTGGVDNANALLKQMKEFAAKTPFEFPQLASATQTMLSFGIAQQDVMGNLKMLGDVSGGNAEKLNSLTLAFSQVQSTGKLMGQDLMQMINAGFNPLSEISKKTGKSIGELKGEMEKGAISAQDVADAFKSATSEGGPFFGMMEKQSQTLTGLISTLKDNIGQLFVSIGNKLMPTIKKMIDVVGNLLSNPAITGAIEIVGNLVATLLDSLMPVVEALLPIVTELIGVAANLIVDLLEPLKPLLDLIAQVIQALAPVIQNVGKILSTVVVALTPLIELATQLLTGILTPLMPLIQVLSNLLVSLSPLLTVISNLLVAILTPAIQFVVAVVTPIVDAISFIIEKGEQAANFIASIFGGGETPAEKAKAVTKEEPGSGASITPGGAVVPPPTTGLSAEEQKKRAEAYKKAWMLDNDLRYEAALRVKNAAEDAIRFAEQALRKAPKRIIGQPPEDELAKRRAEMLDESQARAMEMQAKAGATEMDRIQNLHDWEIEQLDILLATKQMHEDEYRAKKFQADEALAVAVAQMQLDQTKSILSNLSEIAGENFELQKAFSVGQAVINTYEGATKALAQGGIMGPILAATVIGAGMAQVAKIIATKPGSKPSGGGGTPSASPNQPLFKAPSVDRVMSAPRRIEIQGELRGEGKELVGVIRKALPMEVDKTL